MTHFPGESWNSSSSHLPNPAAVYGPGEVGFPQIWNQEGQPSYSDIIGFQDLGKAATLTVKIQECDRLNVYDLCSLYFFFVAVWPRSQVSSFVSQRLSSPRTALTPSNSNANPPATSASAKSKRRRIASMAQRRAANIRERRRMFNLNEGKNPNKIFFSLFLNFQIKKILTF